MNSIRTGILNYIAMKRAMGFSFGRQERDLLHFCTFMEKQKTNIVTLKLAQKWALGTDQTPTWIHAVRLSIARAFAVYWKSLNPKTEVWPPNFWKMRYKRRSPYIYKDNEVQKLLKACLQLQPEDELRPHTYYALFGLIATCGLRLSEATKLTLDDVDLEKGLIHIRRTKFNKTRMIPVQKSTIKALRDYADARKKFHPKSQLSFFFITNDRPIGIGKAEWTFDKIAVAAGVRKTSRQGPRIHDLRHTFIMRTIEGWYREKKDVEALLPILSTYVGHSMPSSTYWYLTLTPELMELASQKMDYYLGGLSA